MVTLNFAERRFCRKCNAYTYNDPATCRDCRRDNKRAVRMARKAARRAKLANYPDPSAAFPEPITTEAERVSLGLGGQRPVAVEVCD